MRRLEEEERLRQLEESRLERQRQLEREEEERIEIERIKELEKVNIHILSGVNPEVKKHHRGRV